MYNVKIRRWVLLAIFSAAFMVLLANMSWWEASLRFLFPQQHQVLYPTAGLLVLVGEHMKLVAASSGLTVLIGIPRGICLTRRSGQALLPIVNDLTSFGQTFPPVAVLA